MGKFIDETGNKYNYLTVLERDFSLEAARRPRAKTFWKCKCDCGNITIVSAYELRKGLTKSCGCLRKKNASQLYVKHGLSRFPDGTIRPEFNAWVGIKTRCYNKNRPEYKRYGGRGIKVCDRWKDSFENFLEDMGERPSPRHSIDRIDVDGDYEPSNCRWATDEMQSRNQRLRKDNNTGVRGVRYYPEEGLYRAGITFDKRWIELGEFNDLKEAEKARKQAENKYWK